jgi:hypothetical protein
MPYGFDESMTVVDEGPELLLLHDAGRINLGRSHGSAMVHESVSKNHFMSIIMNFGTEVMWTLLKRYLVVGTRVERERLLVLQTRQWWLRQLLGSLV